MGTNLTRRSMLKKGAVIGSLAIGGSIMGIAGDETQAKPVNALPWQWKEIKPSDIQERAYQSAWDKIGCMYGVTDSIIGTLADAYGAPYNSFPIGATIYGSGGIAGLGSVCGAINGCGLVFNLFAKNQTDLFALCKELSHWYEKTVLPVYKPEKAKEDIVMVTSVAESMLCNDSSSTWAKASGYKLLTPQHFERCNRLVADVAAKAVAMLNDYAAGRKPKRKN